MKFRSIEELAKVTRKLADELQKTDVVKCFQRGEDGLSCLDKEAKRQASKWEKRQGWSLHRPFDRYVMERLCPLCRAYLHAEQVAQVMYEMTCWQIINDAKQKNAE